MIWGPVHKFKDDKQKRREEKKVWKEGRRKEKSKLEINKQK